MHHNQCLLNGAQTLLLIECLPSNSLVTQTECDDTFFFSLEGILAGLLM